MGELAKGDEERLRAVEKVAAVAKVLGIFVTAIATVATIAIGNLISTVGALQEAKLNHIESISRIEKIIAADSARTEKAIDRLDGRLQKLSEPPKIFQTNSTPYYYHEHMGKIVRIDLEHVTLNWQEGEAKIDFTAPIAPGARVLVKGKPAKLEDLKPGMTIRVLHSNGHKIELLETIEEMLPPPPPKVKEAGFPN